jgi:alanine racemase
MDMEDDFARCGIAIYGYSELDPSFGKFDLMPVLKLKADQISSRFLTKGQRVGYGGVGKVESDSIVSSYDLGYGDGLFRYDGRGDLMIDESRVLGRISMDSFMIEGAKNVVEVIGDASYFARYFNTITYEILVKLSPNIRKVIVK